MKTAIQLTVSTTFGLIALGAVVFLPAGTFDYWQAWAFIAIFTAATIIPTIYIARTNPAALRRRMHAGPRAEARTVQKFAVTAAFSSMFAMMAFSAYDHRMGWSHVPTWVCVLGGVAVMAGLGLAMLVIVQNGYAASTVTVETGQPVVSTGVYKLSLIHIYLDRQRTRVRNIGDVAVRGHDRVGQGRVVHGLHRILEAVEEDRPVGVCGQRGQHWHGREPESPCEWADDVEDSHGELP